MPEQGLFAPVKAIEKNSCHHCAERTVGCHASCDRYLRYRQQLETEKEQMKGASRAERALDELAFAKYRRKEKRKRK